MAQAKESTKATARRKPPKRAPAAVKKAAGRRPGHKDYTPKQKAMALLVVDFYGGNLTRAERTTGINRSTLLKWRDELLAEEAKETPGEIQTPFAEGSEQVSNLLVKLVEEISVALVMKAQETPVRDLSILLGIICDKIDKLEQSRNARRVAGEINVHRLIAPRPAPPQPLALQPAIEVDTQKERWEESVRRVMAEGLKEGIHLTRDQAVEAIIQQNPEAREHLIEEYPN